MDNGESKKSFTFSHPVLIARVFFILLTTVMGMILGAKSGDDPLLDMLLYSVAAFLGAVLLVVVEYATNVISSRKILLAAFGMLMGLIFSQFVYTTIPEKLVDAETSRLICNAMFGYFGVILALKHSDWLRPGNLRFFMINPAMHPKVLDSSVLIDGRIVDVIALGLLSGQIIIPNFVLIEIQGIADSHDSYRRARGRRGLEVLDKLRENCKSLDVIDTDFPDQSEVDQKLILLCNSLNADLVTNDYNLQKVAQLRQITVVNLNEVADALRPIVFVGELIETTIVKPGKEPGQGLAFLKDGTMVVVDDTEELIGQQCEVVISNILQQPTGRLIFARLHEKPEEQSA